MVWSFLWRWVAASAVLVPLILVATGFLAGVALGEIPPNGGPPTLIAALVGTAIWAFRAARQRK